VSGMWLVLTVDAARASGFQGGHAIASVIFGDYNPGGKLPYALRQNIHTRGHHILTSHMMHAVAPENTCHRTPVADVEFAALMSMPASESLAMRSYTLYDSDYITQINMTDMDFSNAPGRSYKFYTGAPLATTLRPCRKTRIHTNVMDVCDVAGRHAGGTVRLGPVIHLI
jgi:hypothetical protein